MIINFGDWFKELCENYVWFSPASQHHEPETFRQAANKVYMQYVASEQFPPIQEARKHVYNVLCKIQPDKKVGKDWSAKALEKIEEKEKAEWIPVTGEERQRRLAEFKAIIDAAPMVNAMPPISKKQAIEEGGWIPAKPAPYPITSPEEAYVRDRHFEWIKANHEPRTGEKLPGFIDEQTWNVIYDDQHLNGKGL
jgi:hypothetical protein